MNNNNPLKILLYGTSGIGKSTFASCAKKPFFIDVEEGAAMVKSENKRNFPLSVTYDEDSKESMKKLNTFLDAALKSKSSNNYGTLVIDTLSRIDEYHEQEVLAEKRAAGVQAETLSDLSYEGYDLVKYKTMNFIYKCLRLADAKNMDIVFISHFLEKQITKKGQPSYDVVCPRLSNRVMKTLVGVVPYCFYLGRAAVNTEDGTAAVTTTTTQLYTENDTFCTYAKSRYMLDKPRYCMTPTERKNKKQFSKDIETLSTNFWKELYKTWETGENQFNNKRVKK